MRNYYTLGLTACALFAAVSGAALAADIPAGNYAATGFITTSTCKVTGIEKGDASTSTVVYPGAGKAGMILANPATTAKTPSGKGETEVCVASGKVPTTGLNGATMDFNCYADTETADSSLAKITAKFKIGPSETTEVHQVSVATTIPLASCGFTTEGTYSHF